MIVEGKVIVVIDRDFGIVEIFGREVDFNHWKFEHNIDINDYVVETRAVNFSVNVEINQ